MILRQEIICAGIGDGMDLLEKRQMSHRLIPPKQQYPLRAE